MGRAELQTTIEYGQHLPTFSDQEEAENSLFLFRDQMIQKLKDESSKKIQLDFSIESLLTLEEWYFNLETSQKETFAICCALYFGKVVEKNRPDAKWVVEEYAFMPGRYEIGVEEDFMTMMLNSFYSKLEHPKNKKHDSMWRTYQQYFEGNPKVSIDF